MILKLCEFIIYANLIKNQVHVITLIFTNYGFKNMQWTLDSQVVQKCDLMLCL